MSFRPCPTPCHYCVFDPVPSYSQPLSLIHLIDTIRYYPTPKKGAEQVEGRIAFYVGRVPGLKVGVPPVA